jgi:NAD(P)-dependent dehydrogenase (short-subunit alcohol dehydrogenase family)
MTSTATSYTTQLLAGRHALVTGANGGIGQAVCESLARHGAHITLLGRKRADLERTKENLPGSGHGVVIADIMQADQVSKAMADASSERGAIGILVCNAGVAGSSPFTRTSAAVWQFMLDVNLTGTYHCISSVLPSMLENGWGRVVNVASTAGLIGYAYVAAYCAAKHGVIGLTRALALEVAKSGVTVNAVCPGFTDTPLLAGAIDNIVAKTARTAQQAKTTLAAHNPQGRLVKPEEVANAVQWLCLPGSESINGPSIAVAGGEV